MPKNANRNKTPLTGLRAFIGVHLGWLIVGSLIGLGLFFLITDKEFIEKRTEAPVEQQETIYGDEHPQREPASSQKPEASKEDHP